MDNKVLPAVRVPTVPTTDDGDGSFITETPLVDLPPSEKFGFAWPDRSIIPPVPPIPSAIVAQLAANAPGLQSESDVSEHESSESESHDARSGSQEGEASETTPTGESPKASRPSGPSPTPPRFSRAFSTPVSAQLGHLRNPHRTLAVVSKVDGYFVPPDPAIFLRRIGQTENNARFQELSLELADSVQSVIQTLLQISPPHLLDPAKEQFSACSLSVPSASIAAMFTAMKNLNYLSANLSHFAEERGILGASAIDGDLPLHSPILNDFDVGEMLQSVGDVLSGFAAQSGVELVLFHGDVGMKHVSVRGDECGISSSLAYMIRQITDTAEAGDTLEVGLLISSESSSRTSSQGNGDEPETRPSSRSSNSRDLDGPLRVTFELGHKFVKPEIPQENIAGPSSARRKPKLDASFFKRLLRQVGGRIKEDLPPRLFSYGRSFELSVILEPGSSDITSERPMLSAEEQALRQPYVSQNIELATEPSLDELSAFVDTLKGKKVALHASVQGSFAHHLSSYLTAWGLDVSHMSTNSMEEDGMSDSTSGASTEESQNASPPIMLTDSPYPMEINPVEEQTHARPDRSSQPTFVIIDDNVEILRSRLIQFRSEPAFNLSLRQRPKLAAHHRPKSSPQIYRAKGVKPSFAVPQAGIHPVIIHFTSLQNYKIVKDLIHTILSTPGTSQYVPEIIVLLKPAGPRRVLTALRTAILKPIVDPFFTPIATSPCSPGHSVNPYFPLGKDSSPTQRMDRPASPRTASDRSARTVREQVELSTRLPPSPLRESESLEYFSEAAEKLGTSPSSGLVIQSPDGQPAGIFFHPRGPNSRLQRRGTDSSNSGLLGDSQLIMRDGSNLRLPVEARRTSSRRSSNPLSDADIPQGDRPRPFSRPTGTMRHQKSGFSIFAPDTEPPSEMASPLQSPALSRVNKGASPREELAIPPMITNTAPTPPASGPSGPRKSASPPTSPAQPRAGGTPVSRRSFTRKGTDIPQPSPPVKKAKNSTDGNILPPVNVLIVEDNPINQTILSTFMKKKKIKYDVAKNGAEAVAKWKTGGFHLILMDIQMPVMDGIQATKEIRKLEGQRMGNQMGLTPPLEGQQTPSDMTNESKSTAVQTPFRSSVIIVALTASSLQVDRVSALAAGCNDFLTKPVSLQWLNNKIIEWGSIKALQMWADLRPEVVKSIASGQAAQAKNVADKLKVPEKRRSANEPSSPPKSTKTGPSVVEAMRRLSINPSSTRSAAFREVDTPDSDHSDTDRSPAPPFRRGTLASIGSSEGADSVGDVGEFSSKVASTKLGPAENNELRTYREVSGEDALLSHVAHQAAMDSSVADANSLQRPTTLGERISSDQRPSIAEVMYTEGKTGDSQASLPENNRASSTETADTGEVEVAPEGTPNESPPQPNSK